MIPYCALRRRRRRRPPGHASPKCVCVYVPIGCRCAHARHSIMVPRSVCVWRKISRPCREQLVGRTRVTARFIVVCVRRVSAYLHSNRCFLCFVKIVCTLLCAHTHRHILTAKWTCRNGEMNFERFCGQRARPSRGTLKFIAIIRSLSGATTRCAATAIGRALVQCAAAVHQSAPITNSKQEGFLCARCAHNVRAHLCTSSSCTHAHHRPR